MTQLDVEPLRRIVELDKTIAALNARIAPLAKERGEIEERCLANFAQSGIQRTTIDGRTVFLKRELWAKAVGGDTDAVTRALKERGHSDYVKEGYNSSSLSAWLRELARGDDIADPTEAVPEDLRDVLTISEVFKIQTTKG